MGQPHHRSARVWHALSRDLTVLSATYEFIHERTESAFVFPAEACLSFTNAGRWKAVQAERRGSFDGWGRFVAQSLDS